MGDPATLVALGAMLISLFLAGLKFIDRRRALNKEKFEITKKQLNADVERDSIVVRGAEGALLLMEKTLKTANEECEKRINELEEENEALKCEITELRHSLADNVRETNVLRDELKELTRRVDNG
jgi:uncharacterized coiled-coil protein SlyX